MSTTLTRMKNAARAAVVAAVLAGAGLGLAGNASAELYGNPDKSAPYWQKQKFDNCVLMATADMIGELKGKKISELEIIALATVTPSVMHPGSIYIPPIGNLDNPNLGNGTNPVDMLILLEKYGLSGKVGGDYAKGLKDSVVIKTGMDAIQQYLKEGHKVMAIVNAELIWGTEGPYDKADHALVVTGIDTDKGIVYLNDSGNPKGKKFAVKLETFEKAWATSGQSIVVTDQTS
jgi:hypothetical protein